MSIWLFLYEYVFRDFSVLTVGDKVVVGDRRQSVIGVT